MKCPHCGKMHPDDFKVCPYTAKPIEVQYQYCNNEDCDFRNPLPLSAVFCPFCGIQLSVGNHVDNNAEIQTEHHGVSFPLYDIILGETTIEEIAESHGLWGGVVQYEEENQWEIELKPGIHALAFSVDTPIYVISDDDWEQNLEIWRHYIPLDLDMNIDDIATLCRRLRLNYKTVDNKDIIHILFPTYLAMQIGVLRIAISAPTHCPNCGEINYQLEEQDCATDLQVLCRKCKNTFGAVGVIKDGFQNLICCPNCGRTDCQEDGDGYYKCNACNYIW